MQLTRIKLAGFKSFVDPTVLSLPRRLIAIVGPNGCGKSNIIDAVRWVMGESSAKHLRGGAMADVIFNGSSARKPVGQASIELVFDNSSGRIQGPWSRYNEIAIRRLVNRNGQSSYFINDTRCRRRDVRDIFLGTGLGPRSYAIIEQGMISRVIEARPEELRIFLEEAAGISKYKERRRETELRIGHSRDNLERLADIERELDERLQHLRRQAEAARRFRELRREQQQCRAELAAFRYRTLGAAIQNAQRQLAQLETEREQRMAALRQHERERETLQQKQQSARDALDQAQHTLYTHNSDINRIEQRIEHQRTLQQRHEREQGQLARDLDALIQQQQHDRDALDTAEHDLDALHPELEMLQIDDESQQGIVEELEAAQLRWQEQWDTYMQRSEAPRATVEREKTRIELLEQRGLEGSQRLDVLKGEWAQWHTAGASAPIDIRQRQLATQAHHYSEAQQTLAQFQQTDQALRQQLEQQRQQREHLTGSLQSLEARIESLRTLEQAAETSADVTDWLAQHHPDAKTRLSEQLRVEPEWEQAIETVLAPWFDAPLGAPLDALTGIELPACSLALLETLNAPEQTETPFHTAPAVIATVLHGMRLADSLDTALAQRDQLTAGQWFLTPQGTQVGRHWLLHSRPQYAEGRLQRQHDLVDLTAQCDVLRRQRAELEQHLQILLEQIHGIEDDLNAQRATLEAQSQQLVEQRTRLDEQRQREQREQQQREQVERNIEQLNQQLQREATELCASRSQLEEALHALQALTQQRAELEAHRDTLRDTLQQARRHADSLHRMRIQREREAETLAQQCTARREALARAQQQREALLARQRQTQHEQFSEQDEASLTQLLNTLLAQRTEHEHRLSHQREHLDVLDEDLRQHERQRSTLEAALQQLHDGDSQAQGRLGELRAQQHAQREQLEAQDLDPDNLSLPNDIDEATWQQRIDSLERKVQRLGAINLMAIDECEELEARHGHLATQRADLEQALATLEHAMRQIDRETRERFSDTFARVDNGLAELFPKLFGGGQARLALTEEDTLSAGVSIMAQPPGKRIGRIQQLSGGEKALTAVALVFAIFQLNPAPFCLLDEVDAPLDEANVGRFGRLVREMSDRVQFIFITHNKATMEIAEQLTGVTMQEAGISRLVAVDLEQAIELSSAANS